MDYYINGPLCALAIKSEPEQSVDRSITTITGINQEPEQTAGRHTVIKAVAERIPPVLSIEQAATMQDLKPFLKAVADLHRLAILQELAREGGLSVLDLSERLALS